MPYTDIGRLLITAGVVIIAIGFLFFMADKLPIGRLPGDFHLLRGNYKFSIPITTCILVSVVITLLVNFLSGK